MREKKEKKLKTESEVSVKTPAEDEELEFAITIKDLHKSYGKKQVLKGLNLEVYPGELFGFIGKNGSGKTTTMKTVLGLIKADKGEIFVNGERVVYGQTATNKYIGYLPDVPEFYSFMTPAEYLKFCGEITGMDKKQCETSSAELLELVGLHKETHRIKGFSRGMKQKWRSIIWVPAYVSHWAGKNLKNSRCYILRLRNSVKL